MVGYFSYFWLNVLKIDSVGNLLMRQSNSWADWALHFTLGSAYAERSLWLADNPLISGEKMSYPPVADWLSAVLIKLQVPFFAAFIVPSYLFTIALVIVLFLFLKLILESQKAALAATGLFLLNGGLGFYYYIQDIAASETPLKTMLFPPREYTDFAAEKTITFMSFLTSMVYPQRAFTLGFPIVLGALAIIYAILIKRVELSAGLRRTWLAVAAIMLGLSPLIHPHSALAAGVVLIYWFWVNAFEAKRVERAWLAVGASALLIALPLNIVLFSSKLSSADFMAFAPGFMSGDSPYSWPVYWLINWGVVPLLALGGILVSWKKQRRITHMLLPFVMLFLAANLWRFQPWIWDNMKLLAWAAVGISGFAALALRNLWQKGNTLSRLLAVILFAVSIFSGTIEAVRNIEFSQHEYVMYTAEELELVEWVKENTAVQGTWLTSDISNNWLYNLTGRQPLIGYPGWLASHGVHNYWQVQGDLLLLYHDPAGQPELIEKYQIRYATIGPREDTKLSASAEKLLPAFDLIKETENYKIFEIKQR